LLIECAAVRGSTTALLLAVGRQLTWFLRAVAALPWSQQEIRAHFDSAVLAQVSPDQLNSVVAHLAPSGASLIGLLSQDPEHDPTALIAVAAFGGTQLEVSISVDGAGLISGLRLTPYQPPPTSWAQVDQQLAALAPDASLLAARVSPGGSCTPVHQVAASTARPFSLAQAQGLDGSLATAPPADIDTLEWFASPDDICHAFAGLQQLAAQPRLAPLGPILSANDGSIGLAPAQWPTVWFKGGSEPGVLTLGYLATNSKGQTFAVVAMLANPAAPLPAEAAFRLLGIATAAFQLAR
jgi:hypothetical protein